MFLHRVLLILAFVLPGYAQTPPPPYELPNLPPHTTQTVVISASTECSATGECKLLQGNYDIAVQGGAGGVHYDSAGQLLVGNADPHSSHLPGTDDTPLIAIEKLSPEGVVSPLLDFSSLPTACQQISSTSLVFYDRYVLSKFSVNPVTHALFVVTMNREAIASWDPATTTGSCVGNVPSINGTWTAVNLYTYATLALSGPSI